MDKNKKQSFKEENRTDGNQDDDYVFRFPLDHKNIECHPDDTLRLFFRGQIQDLLKIVSLSKNGTKILPNEFSFLSDPDRMYRIFNDD